MYPNVQRFRRHSSPPGISAASRANPQSRSYQVPQKSEQFCSVQNFTVVPVPGHDILTAGWYNGHIYAPNIDLSIPGGGFVDTDRSLDVLAVNDPIFDEAIPLPYYNFGVQEEIDGLTPR